MPVIDYSMIITYMLIQLSFGTEAMRLILALEVWAVLRSRIPQALIIAVPGQYLIWT
jgi:hypothetical protein